MVVERCQCRTADPGGGSLSNLPRPLLLGYIRAGMLGGDVEVERAEARLEAFATREEFSLGAVYVEWGVYPGAFDALMTELTHDETIHGFVVPDLRHVTHEEQQVLRRHDDGGRTPVFVADHAPRAGGPGEDSPFRARSANQSGRTAPRSRPLD
jgi:hypothetical protein